MNKVESALSRTTDTKALVIGTDTLPQVADMFRKLFPRLPLKKAGRKGSDSPDRKGRE